MYDINVKNVVKGRRFFYIFFLIGVIFTILMWRVYVSNTIMPKSSDSSVTSTHVEVRTYKSDDGTTMYSPVYLYKVDGESYVCPSYFSSSRNPGNSNKTVYYDPDNPANCVVEYSTSDNKILLFMVIPIFSIVIAVVNIMKANKRIKEILKLNQTGKLIKNLPYRLEDTGTAINGVEIQRPVVEYVLPSGVNVTLYGDARYDRKTFDSDGMVDLLIDENNPENYFIDFEINRINGNLPQDYYQQNSQSISDNSSVQN